MTQKKQPTDEPRLKKYWTSHALDPYRRRAIMADSAASALLAIEGALRDENELNMRPFCGTKPLEVTIEAWREVDGGTEDLQTSRIVISVPREHDDPRQYDVTVTWVSSTWIDPVTAASPREALDEAEAIVRIKVRALYGDCPLGYGPMAISAISRDGTMDAVTRIAEDLSDPPEGEMS